MSRNSIDSICERRLLFLLFTDGMGDYCHPGRLGKVLTVEKICLFTSEPVRLITSWEKKEALPDDEIRIETDRIEKHHSETRKCPPQREG